MLTGMRSGSVVAAVRAACAGSPAAAAIAVDAGAISYRRLAGDLDAAAGLLRSAGVRPGDVVEVRARRDARLPVGLLAVWELGATAALVNESLPRGYLDDSAVVARPGWRITMAGGEPLAVERCEPPGGPRPRAAGPGHILFTSGTTGRPAAVEVRHDAFARALGWYLGAFRATPEDRVGLLAGVGHDPVLRDMLVPLTTGGTLVVPDADVLARPDRLPEFLRAAGITVLHTTPGLLELLLAACGGDELRGLRLIVSAGAPLLPGTVRRLREATVAVVVNAYGSTETPQLASCQVVVAGPGDEEVPLPVGAGVGGAELLLVGADGRTGADRGEIIVRSPDLARGYLSGSGRPGRFVADPKGVPGYRAYRTGDLGERAGEGAVRVVGRLDRQLSVNGFRVEPEEIERAALRHPAVRAATAAALRAPTGDIVELAVVPAGDDIDARALRVFLRSVLPPHAVPTRVRVVAGIALDANHKARPGLANGSEP